MRGILLAASLAAAPSAAQQAPAPAAAPRQVLGFPAVPSVPAVYQVTVFRPGGPAPPALPPAAPEPEVMRTGSGIVTPAHRDVVRRRCGFAAVEELRRNPRPGELRCLFDVYGPGAFGLLSYLDVPVYQPRTPMPGSHVVAISGLPGPLEG
ncbi:MAG TPA: hypothetical protein VFH27_11960, partial [Longimicrobiaceae bacterium]|nr:hypothetical protein [Longimicrobiaceae bacterium]